MVNEWDDDGEFMSIADQLPELVDLEYRDPFDISKALEGAALDHLNPEVKKFELHTDYSPSGDQPKAIEKLISQLENSQERCVLLGVTGSGKTFTMANIIERMNIPTLIISHNKTLARQLHHEVAEYFPKNAVEYYVSHYDYYQPEAYLAKRDLYIDKEMSINERIEQERFSAVSALLTRPDCVIVSSVSCIYGLNPPDVFLQAYVRAYVGQEIEPQDLVRELVDLQYKRVPGDLARGEVRLRGEVLDVWMPSRDDPLRIKFDFDGITSVQVCDPVSWEVIDSLDEAWIHPKELFATSPDRHEKALESIEMELQGRLAELESQQKIVEHLRLQQRTNYDLEMLREVGFCSGVENYSAHFDQRKPGERPYCLLDFFAACARQFHGDADKFLVIMDESHVTLPQVGGMYFGDKSRKESLIEHGFRLPSAADNRPLKMPEFQKMVPQMIYVSATPGERELRHLCEISGQEIPKGLLHAFSKGGAGPRTIEKKHTEAESLFDLVNNIEGIAKMEIRPTGLLDPKIEVRGTEGQVADLLSEINARTAKGERTLVTVLTIKFAEEVSEYLNKMGVKAHYLHSEIDTLERTEIINALRLGIIDVIVGINLLREGLDIPEVSLVAIFDAGKQGFLRNERSLLQTMGKAARNSNGQVLLYSDDMSPAMEASIRQTLERRARQETHNKENGITPQTIQKALPEMGQESSELIAGTNTSKDGKKRLVSRKGGRADGEFASRLNLSSALWTRHTEEDKNSIEKSNSQLEFHLSRESPTVIGGLDINTATEKEIKSTITKLKAEMQEAAAELEFETAANLRDQIHRLELLL